MGKIFRLLPKLCKVFLQLVVAYQKIVNMYQITNYIQLIPLVPEVHHNLNFSFIQWISYHELAKKTYNFV